MSNSNISRKWIINIVAFLLALIFSVGLGYIFIYLNSGIPVNVADIPKGESDKKLGQVITAVQSQSIKDNGVRINFPQFNTKQDGTTQQQKSQKTTSIVAATFGDQIRLIDFFVTGINEKPELSFKSTARGMVFINPLFAGLPFEKRVNIFQAIEQDSKFQDLVKTVAASSSLLDDQVINLSTDIAINIAKDNNLFLSNKKTSYLPDTINPDNIEAKNIAGNSKTKNPWQIVSNWFIPSVQAQSNDPQKSRLEYTLTQQFPKDKLFFDFIPADQLDYPIWHGMKLDASDGTVKIVGTSPLVQQVIVVPKDKRKPSLDNDDYGGAKKLDADVVAEALLKPADLGIWDVSVFKTVTGGNQIEQVLTPRNGGNWQPGEYSVLISAGMKLNRTGEGQAVGAMYLNIASYIMDTLTLVIGKDEDNTKTDNIDKAAQSGEEASTIYNFDKWAKVGQLVTDCGKNIFIKQAEKSQEKEKNNDFDAMMEIVNSCVTNPEKLIKIGEIFDLKVDEGVIKELSKLIEFQWKVSKKAVKRVVQVINVADKGIALSRIFWLGQYLNREIEEGLYIGEFSVVEKPYVILSDKLDSAEIKLECLPGEGNKDKKYQALDVIFETKCFGQPKSGIISLKITNYSKNAVELQIDVSNYGPELLYPDEKIEYDVSNFNIDASKHGKITTLLVTMPMRVKFSLKSYSPYNVAHEFTIGCGTEKYLWGLSIETECVPPGLRAKYRNTTKHTISLNLVGSSDPPIVLEGKGKSLFSSGGSGTLQSSSTKVNISLVSNP